MSKHREIFAILSLCAAAVPAAAGMEGAALEASSSFGELRMTGFARVMKGAREAAMEAKSARPASGAISGAVGGRPVSLSLDRRGWTLRGAADGGLVDVRIDHDAKTIRGVSGEHEIDVAFDWTSERAKLSGARGKDRVNLTVDFIDTGIYGYIGEQFIKANYDREGGTLRGHAKNAPIDLTYDKLSGRMRGTLRGVWVELTLVNLEMGDFLQYFFLLVD